MIERCRGIGITDILMNARPAQAQEYLETQLLGVQIRYNTEEKEPLIQQERWKLVENPISLGNHYCL